MATAPGAPSAPMVAGGGARAVSRPGSEDGTGPSGRPWGLGSDGTKGADDGAPTEVSTGWPTTAPTSSR